ncbi:MAG TPA: hypothetical protein VH079_16145, partial [Terriglobales bacterium]|nr:hypothetical protein [Terriglobales bacterium]
MDACGADTLVPTTNPCHFEHSEKFHHSLPPGDREIPHRYAPGNEKSSGNLTPPYPGPAVC